MAAKHTLIVVGVAGVVVVGLVVAGAVQKKLQDRTASPPPTLAPPANVQYVEYTEPIQVIRHVNGVKGGARDRALAEVVGKYTPTSGWEGNVAAITEESGGRIALRMNYSASTMIGGEYWLVAIVGKDHGVKVGQTIMVQGRIKDVVFKTGAASVIQSVILDDARVNH